MKKLLCFLILLPAIDVMAQENLDERIKAVESNLMLQQLVGPDKDWTTSTIDGWMLQDKVRGVSVAVIDKGQLAWSKAYGEAFEGEAVKTSTLFQCASIGKLITALASLQLVEKGQLDLDRPVNDYLKQWKIPDHQWSKEQPVTLRHLLSHSAGFTDEYGFPGYPPDTALPTVVDILNGNPPANVKKKIEVQNTPGTVERYSGAGYLIVQLLIEDVSGLSFEAYVQTSIFDPLGMVASTYAFDPDRESRTAVAHGHRSNGKPLKKRPYHVYPEKAAAGFWTTPSDLARFVLGIQEAQKGDRPELLGANWIQTYLTPQIEHKGPGPNLKGIDKPEAFWHAGQNEGYTALLYGLIESGSGAVIMTNSDGGERLVQAVITSVAAEYNWPVMRSYKSIAVDPEDLVGYTGTYVNIEKEAQFEVRAVDGSLEISVNGAKKGYPLIQIGPGEFTFPDAQDYYRIRYDQNTEGERSLTFVEGIGKITELNKTD